MTSNAYGYPPAMTMQGQQAAQGQTVHQQPYGGGYAVYPGAAYPAASGNVYPTGPGMGQYQTMPSYAAPQSTSFFNLGNDRFVKGLLIGAAAAYLLTNEDVQRTAIKGVVKVWSALQGGVEEVKERFRDAEAELQAGEADK
jgi:hypothetical protein